MDVLATALSGLDRAQGLFEQSANRLIGATGASPSSGQPASDAVDLSQAAVSLLTAKNQFALNINLLEVAENMQKTTIDILA